MRGWTTRTLVASGSLERFAGGDDDIAGNVPVPLHVVLAGDGLVELRLNDILDGTALLEDAIEICAQGTVDKVAQALLVGSLLEVVANLNIALLPPGRARLLKAGMEQGEDQLTSMFEGLHAVVERGLEVWNVHKDHVGDHIVKCLVRAGPA